MPNFLTASAASSQKHNRRDHHHRQALPSPSPHFPHPSGVRASRHFMVIAGHRPDLMHHQPPAPPPRGGIVKCEAPYDDQSRLPSSTSHVLDSAPPVQPVRSHQHQLPPYHGGQPPPMNNSPLTPVNQYEHPSHANYEPFYNVYSSSSKKKNTRVSQVRVPELVIRDVY